VSTETVEKVARGYRFNPDVDWQNFVYAKYKKICAKIAFKYCMADADLREDLEQEAMMALMTIDPKEIKGYEEFQMELGDTEEGGELHTKLQKEWDRRVDTYCRQVTRNSVLAVLASNSAGNWYTGRKKKRKNPVTGEAEYVSTPATYVSFDAMFMQGNGVQIGTDGVIYIDGALYKYSDREHDQVAIPRPNDNLER
jgi:hypothetical protein